MRLCFFPTVPWLLLQPMVVPRCMSSIIVAPVPSGTRVRVVSGLPFAETSSISSANRSRKTTVRQRQRQDACKDKPLSCAQKGRTEKGEADFCSAAPKQGRSERKPAVQPSRLQLECRGTHCMHVHREGVKKKVSAMQVQNVNLRALQKPQMR